MTKYAKGLILGVKIVVFVFRVSKLQVFESLGKKCILASIFIFLQKRKNSDLECLLHSNLAVSLRQTPPEPQAQPHASPPPVCCFVPSISHLIFFPLY